MNLKLSSYSQGMEKRFALAVSMINDPENFIFDEVLNGLDPQGIVFSRELAINFKRKGKAVLFSSHILSEVEDIADRVVFIHRGKIIGEYTVEEIRNKAKPAIELLITKITDDALSTLKKYGDPVLLENGKIVLKNPIVDTEHILTELISRGVRVSCWLMLFDFDPWLHRPRAPFIGAHVIGLHPFRVTPTHSSPSLGSQLWGNPHILALNAPPTWVFTVHPHRG
ncbi:MAG: hypothetical protein QXV11_01950 [Desulfurococcaceae archaeon]